MVPVAMVFGFSWGEVALILGASAALFGPKDIVIIGRAAGRLTGKAVGYIQNARGHIAPIMHKSEINTVHKELRETMAQLEAIRHEMRTGISIMSPGPMTSRVLDSALESSGKEHRPSLDQLASVTHPISGPTRQVSPTQIVLQMENLQAASKQDRSTGIVTPASTVSAFSSTKGTPVNLASSIQAPSKLSDGIVGKTSVQELVVLPISAVEAGLLPSKQEPISGGADIVLASIVERKVAFQSKSFLEHGEI